MTVNLRALIGVLLQMAATLVVVAVIRASVLRVREVYADWRAAIWGAEAALDDILRRHAERDKGNWWSRVWSLHPPPQYRLVTLRDPIRLFRVSPDLPFLAGILLAFVLTGGIQLTLLGAVSAGTGSQGISLRLFGALLDQTDPQIAGLTRALTGLVVFGTDVAVIIGILALLLGAVSLVSGTVGLQVQREAVSDLAFRRGGIGAYLKLLVPAVLLAVGLEVGFLISPYGLLSPRSLISVLLVPVWLAGVVGAMWLGLVYMRFFSRRLMGARVGSRRPRAARRLLMLGTSILLTGFYLSIVAGRMLIIFFEPAGAESVFLLKIVVISLGAALFVYAFGFGTTWVLVTSAKTLTHSRCENCGQLTRQRLAVGFQCEHCGADLASWLYVDDALQPVAEREMTTLVRRSQL